MEFFEGTTTFNQTTMIFKDEDYKAKDINPNALVRQDNQIISNRWKMNLNQSRIFLTAVSMIGSNDEEFEAYRIRGKDLKKILDLKGNSIYKQLEKDMPKLMKTYIEVSTEDGEGKEWISLMSSAKYSKGDLYLKFNDSMKPFLLDLKSQFTQFKLQDAMQFKSTYTLRLFMMLKQFDANGWRYMTVDEIRQALNLNKSDAHGVKKDIYPLVADLKKRVLVPGVNELKETGMKVKMEEIKDGRKIIAFKFKWNGKNQVEQIELTPKTESDERMVFRLRRMGLNDRQIKYIGSLVGAENGITPQQLQRTVFGIEKGIRDKNVPDNKKGGYAYVTFTKKFGMTGL